MQRIDDDVLGSDDSEEEDVSGRVQSSLLDFFAPSAVDAFLAGRPTLNDSPPPVGEAGRREAAVIGRQGAVSGSGATVRPCNCCSHCVCRVQLPAAVSVLESHPACQYVVCGMANNTICFVGSGSRPEEEENTEETVT